MAVEELRNPNNTLRAKIYTDSKGVKTIKDAKGVKKGIYDPRSDTTKKANGVAVGKGNLLASLVE